jgi:AraC-like DNA-binding protein
MAFSTNAVECVAGLLAERLEIVELQRKRFAPGVRLGPSVVNSYRLLLVRRGSLSYSLEGWSVGLKAGGLLLVPAWMKRFWRAGGRGAVNLSWVAFNPLREALYAARPFHWRSDNPAREGRAFTRLLRAWNGGRVSEAESLMLEGEVKALLGRLAHGCAHEEPVPGPTAAMTAVEQEIALVGAWIERNHHRPDVLDGAMRLVRSSDHYFRSRFRDKTGLTLGRYAAMVRMRRARFLLSSSALAVKDVAWQTGFRDPLHFSRAYRKFWGHPPKMDRR